MPTVDWNRDEWGAQHRWEHDGDEWSGMAAHCRQPYRAWKLALIEAFLLPHTGPDRDALEIAPGHGRWSEALIDTCRHVTLVDLNPSCIDACRARFGDRGNLELHVNDGRTLPSPDDSVDLVWSFDSFVHMDADVIESYVGDIARVLRPGGIVVLHHADKREVARSLDPVAARLGKAGLVARRVIAQGRVRDSGNRSDVSAAAVAAMAEGAGLHVLQQTARWGAGGRYTVTKYHDAITVAGQPHPALPDS